MAFGWDPEEQLKERLRALGIEPEEPEPPSLWKQATAPVRAVFGATPNVAAQLAGLVLPEEYKRAAEESAQAFEVTEGSNILEKTAALPHLGDVLWQLLPEEKRQDPTYQALGMIPRMIAGVATDPLTYTPFVAGKVGTAIRETIPAYKTAKTAIAAAAEAGKIAEAGKEAQLLNQAIATGNRVQRAGAAMAAMDLPIDRALMIGGLVYTPELVQGVGIAASDAWKQAQEGQYGQAAIQGVNATLLASLGALIGKGVISTARASEIFKARIATENPALVRAAEAAGVRPEPAPAVIPEAPGATEAPRPGLEPAPEIPVPEPTVPTVPVVEPTVPTPLPALEGEVTTPKPGPRGRPQKVSAEAVADAIKDAKTADEAHEALKALYPNIQRKQTAAYLKRAGWKPAEEAPKPVVTAEAPQAAPKPEPTVEAPKPEPTPEVKVAEPEPDTPLIAAAKKYAEENKVTPAANQAEVDAAHEGMLKELEDAASPDTLDPRVALQERQSLELLREKLLSERVHPSRRAQQQMLIRQVEDRLIALSDVERPKGGTVKVGEKELPVSPGKVRAPYAEREAPTAAPLPEEGPGIVRPPAQEVEATPVPFEVTTKKGEKITIEGVSDVVRRQKTEKGNLVEDVMAPRAEQEAIARGRELAGDTWGPFRDPEKVRTSVERTINDLTTRYGSEPAKLQAGLVSLSDEIRKVRDLVRNRSAYSKALERFTEEEQVRIDKAVKDFTDNRAGYLTARAKKKKGLVLSEAEEAAYKAYRTAEDVLRASPVEADILRLGGLERTKSIIDAINAGDEASLTRNLTEAVERRLEKRAADVADEAIAPLLESLGRVVEKKIGTVWDEDALGKAQLEVLKQLRKDKPFTFADKKITPSEFLAHVKTLFPDDAKAQAREIDKAISGLVNQVAKKRKIDLKARTKEKQIPVTEEGTQIEVPETAVSEEVFKRPGEAKPEAAPEAPTDIVADLQKRVDAASRDELSWGVGKEKRLILSNDIEGSRAALLKYHEGLGKGYTGRQLSEYVFGTYDPKAMSRAKQVYQRFLGKETDTGKTAGIVGELNTKAQAFFDEFLQLPKDKVVVDDAFLSAFKGLWRTYVGGKEHLVQGKATPGMQAIREWAGLAAKTGRGEILERFVENFPEGPGKTRLVDAINQVKRELRAPIAQATRAHKDLGPIKAQPRQVNPAEFLGAEQARALKLERGTYAAHTKGDGRLYFKATDEGKKVVVVGGRGEGLLKDFVNNNLGTLDEIEIPDALYAQHKNDLLDLYRRGLLGEYGRPKGAISRRFKINTITDVSESRIELPNGRIKLDPRAYGQLLKSTMNRMGLGDYFKQVARMSHLSSGESVLAQMVDAVMRGDNMFRWEKALHREALADLRAIAPLRSLMSEIYLRGGTQIFDDFNGIKDALKQIRRRVRFSEEVAPEYMANGPFNAVFYIGKREDGTPLVMKIGTTRKFQLLEERVPELRDLLLPPDHYGTTPEGWQYRVEPMGEPVASSVDGSLKLRELTPEHKAALDRAILKLNELASRGQIDLSRDFSPHQFVIHRGKAYLADRGSVRKAGMRELDIIDLQRDVPAEELPSALRQKRYQQYAEDIAAMEKAGIRTAGFDRAFEAAFLKRVDEAVDGLHEELKAVLDDIAKAYQESTGVDPKFLTYRGTMASPFLRGANIKWKTRAMRGVFVNPLQPFHQHGIDTRKVAEDLFGTLLHETIHLDIPHEPHLGDVRFTWNRDWLNLLLHVDGQKEALITRLQKIIEQRRSAFEALIPEYNVGVANARVFGRESWRGAESIPRAAGDLAAGRPARQPYLGGEGAAAAEVRGGAGLQRGGAIPEGLREQAGELGSPAAGRRPYGREAPEAAEVPEGGGEAVGGVQASPARIGPGTVDDAIAIVKSLIADKRTYDSAAVRDRSLSLAQALAYHIQNADPDEFRRLVASKPSRAERWNRFNVINTEGLSDHTKATLALWSDITRRAGATEFAADRVRTWDDIDPEVKRLLNTKTREELYSLLGHKRKGLTDTEMVLARTIGADLSTGVQEAERDLIKAQADFASGRTGLDTVQAASQRYMQATENFLQGMPKILNPITETARALAAAAVKVRALDPEAAMFADMRKGMLERFKTRYKDELDARKVTDELMTMWGLVRRGQLDPEKFASAYRQAFKFSKFDKFLEAYKAGLLGWKSRAANLASNSIMQGIREVERTTAIAMDKLRAKITGTEAERYFGEVKLNSLVARHWLATAAPEWVKAARDGFLLKPEDISTIAKYGTLAEDMNVVVGAIDGKKGEFLRFMFKGLNADDALFKKASQLQEYYRRVYRNVRKGVDGFEKMAGEDDYAATTRLVHDLEDSMYKLEQGHPTDKAKISRYKEIYDEAWKIARKETFQEDLPEFVRGIQKGLQSPMGKPFQILFPFIRTPFNIAKETLARTPLEFLNVASKWNDLSPQARIDALSKPIVGTAIGAAIYNSAISGIITGGGPLDPVEEANLRQTGWQPYSVKIGNQFVSYQRLEPMSSVLGIAADMAEGVKRGDFEAVDEGAVRLISTVTENLTNKTFLSGLEGLSTALSDPQRYMKQWIKQMQMSLVPNNIGFVPFGHLAQAIDPVYRETHPMAWDVFQSKIPGASMELAPQYTPTGELRKRLGTPIERLVSPLTRTTVRTDPTAVAASLLDQIGSPPTPPKQYTYIQGIKVDLLPEERAALAKAQDEATKLIGGRLVKDPNFMKLPDNEDVAPYGATTKKDVVKKLYDRYRRRALSQFQGNLQKRARQQAGAAWRAASGTK